jgi:hypothetical protein
VTWVTKRCDSRDERVAVCGAGGSLSQNSKRDWFVESQVSKTAKPGAPGYNSRRLSPTQLGLSFLAFFGSGHATKRGRSVKGVMSVSPSLLHAG